MSERLARYGVAASCGDGAAVLLEDHRRALAARLGPVTDDEWERSYHVAAAGGTGTTDGRYMDREAVDRLLRERLEGGLG